MKLTTGFTLAIKDTPKITGRIIFKGYFVIISNIKAAR